MYFHIAKTGGSSIYNLLHKNNLDDCVLSDRKVNYNQKFESEMKYYSWELDYIKNQEKL